MFIHKYLGYLLLESPFLYFSTLYQFQNLSYSLEFIVYELAFKVKAHKILEIFDEDSQPLSSHEDIVNLIAFSFAQFYILAFK